jgi:hypothetical protein
MIKKEHKNQTGLEKIVYYKALMHNKLSNQLLNAFPNSFSLREHELLFLKTGNNDSSLDPNWISGFFEGDGSFYIIMNSKSNSVYLRVSIHLHIRDEFLLCRIQQYFGGLGTLYKSKNSVDLKVFKQSDLISILSHFNSYFLIGFKRYNFLI